MAKYNVCVTRTITESAFIEITANSVEEAEEIANQQQNTLNYEIDDNPALIYSINVEEI